MKKLYIFIALVNVEAALQAALEAFKTGSMIAIDNLTPAQKQAVYGQYTDRARVSQYKS